MLVTKFIPEVVEVGVVWPPDNVRKFMEQSVSDLLHGQELSRVMMVTQADEDLLGPIDVQAWKCLAGAISRKSTIITYPIIEVHLVGTQQE